MTHMTSGAFDFPTPHLASSSTVSCEELPNMGQLVEEENQKHKHADFSHKSKLKGKISSFLDQTVTWFLPNDPIEAHIIHHTVVKLKK
jgi:hypothetical protein